MTDYTIGADKGFQCTFWCWVLSDYLMSIFAPYYAKSLNAPSGAGCFLTISSGIGALIASVLMHLLVLGAF